MKSTEITSNPIEIPLRPTSPSPLAVQKFEGLSLEPLNKNLVDENDEGGDAEAITKEEEWVTKRKTELTTTRQIETRVKRQVVLEDGRVVEDSGPIVSTNTTEDTDKKESESTERRDLGNPDVVDNPKEIEFTKNDKKSKSPLPKNNNLLTQKSNIQGIPNGDDNDELVLTPRAEDGLVREINEKRIVSREEIKERLEIEDIRHLGDFSDQAFVNAVNSGAKNLETILYSPEQQKQLVSIGPQIVHQSTKAHKTVDTEDIEKKCLAKPDGTLITEKKKTTEHEELFDEDLPDKDDNSTGSREKINTTEASQRYFKQRDEQNVEYIADGKVIAKEMRYAAETEQMERDGPPEGPNDWDSLSDRIRKARRTQKTLLQQQKEAALLADRKDALTKRPLDFDREEETRKGETMKWLESHFGSESTASSESRDGDHDADIEPTKKTYFNVTIKSNQTATSPIGETTSPIIGNNNINNNNNSNNGVGLMKSTINGKEINGHSQSKIIMPEREMSSSKTKYFQGISNWSDRKESTPKHFASKAFRDELQGTLEKNRLRHVASREDVRYVPNAHKTNDDYVRREDIIQQKRQQFGSRTDLRLRKDSREDSDDSKNIRIQKEDLGYLSGSRTDLRYRRDSNEDHERNMKNRNKTNAYLKREDSGYVKDSREDVRSSLLRDIEDEKYKNSLLQRDDSAYVSSSTYFTDTRLPKTPQLRTPDSGIRSPSPEVYEPISDRNNSVSRPTVPQRRRAIEKKLRSCQQTTNYSPPSPIPFRHHAEPPPDYSPPPRSRSVSPGIHNLSSGIIPICSNGGNGVIVNGTPNGISSSSSSRKQNQRTRFASESSLVSQSNHQKHQTLQRSISSTPRTAVATQTTPSTPKTTKVGQAIGNSLRKLVGKIRSASAERKFKMKSKSKSRERSPSPQINGGAKTSMTNGSTYQQYNVIDSHISGTNGSGGSGGNLSNGTGGIVNGGNHNQNNINQHNNNNNNNHHHHNNHQINHNNNNNNSQRNSASMNRESSVVSSSTTTAGLRESRCIDRTLNNNNNNNINNYNSVDRGDRRGSSDLEMLTSPKQRYYLGEDPYGGNSIFGKENKYDSSRKAAAAAAALATQQIQQQQRARRADERETYIQSRNISSSTLGRYQKAAHNYRLGSTPNLDHDYRNTQTLPRKLDHRTSPHHHSSTINVSIVNQVKPTANTGPAKPARTYKTLNRSKSFNVHGMNGTNDPSPIYIEKLTKNNYSSNLYKSNPHLHETGPQLKSPSIVNLISRSQKDLTRIDDAGDKKYSSNYLSERRYSPNINRHQIHNVNGNGGNYLNGHNHNGYDKKNVFLKGLQDQAPELYRTLHGDESIITTNGSRGLHKYPMIQNSTIHNTTSSSLGSRSPIEINKDTASIIRRGSSSTDDYNETYKITTKSDDPKRPSITNTIQNYTKKTIPIKDGRGGNGNNGNGGYQTIQSSERKSVTTSRYHRNEPITNLKYLDEQQTRRGSNGNGGGGGGVGSTTIIEVRGGNSRK